MGLFATGLSAVGLGSCVIADPVRFENQPNYPPSVIFPPNSQSPQHLIRLQADELLRSPDAGMGSVPRIEVEVWDPDTTQTLQYFVYVDDNLELGVISPNGPVVRGELRPGTSENPLKRDLSFVVPAINLQIPGCHRVDLRVSSLFDLGRREPVIPNDLAIVSWWVAVKADAMSSVDMTNCPDID